MKLKFVLKKQDGLGFSDSELTPTASYCAHDNESSCSMKWWDVLVEMIIASEEGVFAIKLITQCIISDKFNPLFRHG